MATTRRTSPRAAPRAPAPERFPPWIAPVVYALAAVIVFREAVFGQATLLGTDSLALSYFARDFYTDFVRAYRDFPLWDPYLYGGLPFVEGMHGDIFYPPSMAMFFLDASTMWGWKMLLHVFAAGVFTYLWLRELGVRASVAFVGGLAYMLGADLVSLVFPGGDGKLFVSALAPLAFWLTERAMARRRIADFAFLALGVALVMFTSHMQLAYFTVWGISLYALFRAAQVWREEGRGAEAARLFGLFALAGVLGVGAAAAQFVPPLQYLREYSHRAERTNRAQSPEEAYAYATQFSLHPEEIASLVVADFAGDNVPTEIDPGDTYWGRNFFKLNSEYAGFVPLLLAPLAFLRRPRRRAWFFLALGVLALLYALGANTPAFRLFYLIPGVKLFRAPSVIIFLYALALVTLAALALERYLDSAAEGDDARRTTRRYLWGAAAVTVLLALLASAGAIVSFWTSVVFTDMVPQQSQALAANLPHITTGFWIAALLAVAVAGVWEGLARGALGRTAVVAILAFLVFADLYRVGRPFVRGTALMNDAPDAQGLLYADDTVRFLRERAAQGEVFRAFDLGGGGAGRQNYLAVHGIEQLGGHHGNELGRYRNLIGGDTPRNFPRNNFKLLDLTNTAYVVAPQAVEAPGFEPVYQSPAGPVVYRNPRALPRAYLVGSVEVVPDSAAVDHLLGPAIDLRRTAALPEPLPAGIDVRPDPQGQVSWLRRGINEYALRVTSDRPALLVIADNWHEAWRADVDGRDAPVLRANYVFRAVPVPAGTHTVQLRYRSDVLRLSVFVSVALLLLLLATGVLGTMRGRRAARVEA